MAYQDEILETFKTNLENNVTNKKVRVATSLQNDEQRKPFAVVVSIGQVVNINPMLDDYQFIVDILIDFFIKDDEEGYYYKQTRDEIIEYLKVYLNDKTKLEQFFGNDNIVGLFLNDCRNQVSEGSNQTLIQLRVIGSW